MEKHHLPVWSSYFSPQQDFFQIENACVKEYIYLQNLKNLYFFLMLVIFSVFSNNTNDFRP